MSLYLDNLAKSIEALERSIKTANRVDDSDEDLQEQFAPESFIVLRLLTNYRGR